MSTATVQRRFLSQQRAATKLQNRAEGENQTPKIIGYASVFYREGDPGTEYQLWDDMVERIMPGAFDRAIREDDCRGLFNHDPNQVLGRSTAGTLGLSVDATGLKYEIDPPDTGAGRDTVTSIKRGDVTGSSFSFVPVETVWREVEGVFIREILEVQLWDVGPVTFPAYESSTTGVRQRAINPESREDLRAELEAFRTKQAAEKQPSEAERQQELDRIDTQARLVELGL